MNKGVYFSANDAVLPWAKAFLRSFRQSNPELPLTLIPFDDNCRVLQSMADEYHFDCYEDPDGFARLENIGRRYELGFSKTGPNWFRRYAAYWGPYDQFIYLDVRQLILGDLTVFFQTLNTWALDFIFYDCALNQVYEPGTLRNRFLLERRGRGFNSGRWASRKGVFTLEDFEHFADESLKEREQLNPRNTDQAFINYCCDAKALKAAQLAELTGKHVHAGWVGQRGKPYQDSHGTWRLWDYGGLDHKKEILLWHWAGFPLEPWVPHFNLLKKYGALSPLTGSIKGPMQKLLRKLRANRFINETVHRLKQ